MSIEFLTSAMRRNPFTVASAVILELLGLVHVIRLFTGWEVIVEGAIVPVWFSGFAAVLLLSMAALIWLELWRQDKPGA